MNDAPDRYLVVGMAKTGTTIISKTLHSTLGSGEYYLEPKRASAFETMAMHDDASYVVKILYNHWMTRPRLLSAIVAGEFGNRFQPTVLTIRDPRAIVVSTMHFVALPYFRQQVRPSADVEEWMRIFREKEEHPETPLRVMIERLADRFDSQIIRSAKRVHQAYLKFLSSIPVSRKTIVRYEDFMARRLPDDVARLFAVEASEVPPFVRRSGDRDDWPAFLTKSDLDWLNEELGFAIDAYGYPREVTIGGAVDPARSSGYVAKLIARGSENAKLEP